MTARSSSGKDAASLEIGAGDLTARILTLGAALQDLRLEGVGHGLVLGSPDIDAYRGPMRYFGAVIGPVANRIGGGEAVIDGERHRFPRNQDGRHTLHSGAAGTHASLWSVLSAGPAEIVLETTLADGDGGFPGERTLRARYEIAPPSSLTLTVEATTSAPTLMMVAHHPYWNLDGGETWDGHTLTVAAANFLPVDDDTLPTGEVRAVDGTAFDFRAGRSPTGTFDNSLCLARMRRPLTDVARLDGASGVSLSIATTEPALHIYGGHGIHGEAFPGHDGRRYGPRSALALEPQFWPDAPNHPDFPSILLRPGEPWLQQTRYTIFRR